MKLAKYRKFRKDIQGDQTVHYVSERLKRPRPKPKLQPPLMPMIDVTFLLLFYFLLTTTFRQQEGQIPGALPRAGGILSNQVVELRPIRITLWPTGTDRSGCVYELSGLSAAIDTPAKLYDALVARGRLVGSKEIPVIIRPRRDVRWRHVVETFNQVVRAKFKRIGFVSGG